MFCKNCSRQIEDDSDVCPYCGVKQSSEKDILDDIKTSTTGWLQTEGPELGVEIYKEAIEPALNKVKKAVIKKIKKAFNKVAKETTKIIRNMGKSKHYPF